MYWHFNHSKVFLGPPKKGLGKGCLGKRHFPAPHSSPQITRRCVVNLPLFFTVSTPSTRYRRADLSSASNQSPVVMVSPIRARRLQSAAAGSPGSAPIPPLPFKQPCYRFFNCSADLLFPPGRSSQANLEGRWPAVLSGDLYAPSTDGLASVNFFPCTNMLYSDIQEHVSLGVFHDEPRFVFSGAAEMIYYLSCNTGAEIYVLPRHG